MPTAVDTQTPCAAFSLVMPVAISTQNSRSISLRSDGAPGERIAPRLVNFGIHPAGRRNTSIKVLRRPYEFALLGSTPSIIQFDRTVVAEAFVRAGQQTCRLMLNSKRKCSIEKAMRSFMGSMFQHKLSFGLELIFHEPLDCFGLTLAFDDQSHKAGTVREGRDSTHPYSTVEPCFKVYMEYCVPVCFAYSLILLHRLSARAREQGREKAKLA